MAREISNPIFRSLARQQGGYAQFGRGFSSTDQQGYPQAPYSGLYQSAPLSNTLTLDDVVTKTALTLGILSITAVVSFWIAANDPAAGALLTMIGALGGLALAFFAIFTGKQDSKVLVLSYAVCEGLFLGAISWMFSMVTVPGSTLGGLIGQAILGTFGVFFGMLVVYKTGAIRVTPKMTRMLVGVMFGILVLMLGDSLLSLFHVNAGQGLGLRSGGSIAILFSLVCIGVAAFSFLTDFDAADQLIRAGAPAKAAWGIAFGLMVTLVWLYLEILRLLSYFQTDSRL